jgi:hypothetical protein
VREDSFIVLFVPFKVSKIGSLEGWEIRSLFALFIVPFWVMPI